MDTNSINSSYLTLKEEHDYTYQELCEILKEKPKTGNSKPSQLERWSMFFDFEKISRSIFHVKKVRKDFLGEKYKPYSGSKMECEDEFNYVFFYTVLNRISYYTDYLVTGKYVIFQVENKKRAYIYKNSDLISAMQLRSRNIYFQKPYERFNIKNQVVIDLFKDVVSQKSRYILDSRIEKLENAGVISHKKCVIYLRSKVEIENMPPVTRYYVLPDSYLELWNSCEIEALKELGYRNKSQVIYNKEWNRLQDLIKMKVCEVKKSISPDSIDLFDMVVFEKDYECLSDKYVKHRYDVILKERVDAGIAKLKEFMNASCKHLLEKRIEKYNDEYERKKGIRNSDGYIQSKKEIEDLIEIGFQYPEEQKYFKDVESFIHKFTDEDKKSLLALCDCLVGGIENMNDYSIKSSDITLTEAERKSMAWIDDI